MNFSRSELARLSSKKLVPNVCERAYEYQSRFEPINDIIRRSTRNGQLVLSNIQKDVSSANSGKFSGNIFANYFISITSPKSKCDW